VSILNEKIISIQFDFIQVARLTQIEMKELREQTSEPCVEDKQDESIPPKSKQFQTHHKDTLK